MNTIGKILVVCIFVIALAAAALLGMATIVQQNYKKANDDLRAELTVYKTKVESDNKTNADLNMQVKKSEEDKKVSENRLKEAIDLNKDELKSWALKLEEETLKVTEGDLATKSAIAELSRLKEEVTGLLNTLKKREFVIVELEKDLKLARTAEIAAKNSETTFKLRNDNLLAEIRRLTGELAVALNKGQGGTLPNILRDPNAPNPPPVAVKGRVDEINSKDKNLVKLSVGSDKGVKENHTLEVYRTEPRAEYLGTIRIIDSQPHFSIGKIMRSSLPHSALQAGDIVVGSIGP